MARKSCSSKSRTSTSRPSKMGRKWTQDDVLAYKIKVVYQNLQTFFGVTDLPSPSTKRAIGDGFSAQDFATAQEPVTSYMIRYMNNVANRETESSTFGFVRYLLELICYPSGPRRRQVMMWPKLRYLAIPGRPPQLDICMIDYSYVTHLVIKVDRHSPRFDPEPCLISDAIAAFHNDNKMRVKHGTDPLTSMVMPGIVMDGTMPTFYKIPITPELVKAVEDGERPEEETVVHAYRPEVQRPEEGLKLSDNRPIILSCFEAFRQFL